MIGSVLFVNTQMLTVDNYYVLTMGRCLITTSGMTKDAILHMRITEGVRLQIDGLRKQESDLPTRSEMVRRLIERAAAAPARKPAKTKG
jgi:hypothetical protein